MTSLDENLDNSKSRRFAFKSSAYDEHKFSVVTMSGFEAISKNYSVDLILVSDDEKIDFGAMLSNPATFEIFSADGENSTPYHGVLSEFEQLHKADIYVFYRAVLTPKMQRLSLYRTSEVYLNDQTIPDILETVLKRGGLKPGDFKNIFRGTYRTREFVCQYQETDFDFVTRWMEKEGIYYYFDHSGEAEKLVLIDESSAQPGAVLNVSYRPEENISSGPANDSVQSFVCRQKPLPKQVILQGFNYLHANGETLKETAGVSDKGTGDVMLYGENFLDSKECGRYANLRAQEIACTGKVFSGGATAAGLRSGYFMQIAGHYRTDMNGKYLVTEVEHEGSQAGVLLAGIGHSFGGTSGETSYRCRFRATAADVQFRPARLAIRPHVAGSMSAIVDAEGDGKYAEMDELGQYKVQLPFSTTGKGANNGSARIRMATPYSGSGYGMHFPLHKGAEVLLSFIDGDPDQPVIMNAAPNSENLSVVNNKNASVHMLKTAGGNSLVFEDKLSEERVSVYSPTFKSSWRMGAATTATAPSDVAGAWAQWGANKHGLHGQTEASLGLDVKDGMVVKVGDKTSLPLFQPITGQMQILAGSALFNIDNAQTLLPADLAAKATETGTLDIYAKHINLYAEPEYDAANVLKRYKYTLLTSSATDSDEDTPWGFGDLYKLQSFNESADLKKLKDVPGTKEISASDSTSYTKGNSNSATFGNNSSVTHGSTKSLFRGASESHTYGISSSITFGQSNSLSVGPSTSVSVALAASTSLGGSFALSASASIALSFSTSFEMTAGSKTSVNTVTEISATVTKANADALELSNTLTKLQTQITTLDTTVTTVKTSVTDLKAATLHLIT